MAFDVDENYFVANVNDCAEILSQEELDQLQGLIKKVELKKPRNFEYRVVSKADTPKLFETVLSLTEPFYPKRKRQRKGLEARFHVDCFYELNVTPEMDTEGITWFEDSPDAGDKDCICSKCGNLIPENDLPIRIFRDKVHYE